MKAGDKVVCKDSGGDNVLELGKEYIITDIDENLIEVKGIQCYYNKCRFELVTPPEDKQDFQPTKSFLLAHKDEYVVEYNGVKDLLSDWNETTWGCINEDLTDRYNSEDDIVKIYRLTPVWQRDTRRELTIAEAEKEFGVKIRRSEA